MKSIRFKPKTIEIPQEEPFKNDLLQRKDSAEILAKFIEYLDEPFVLAVDASWGNGKTTFLKMWLQYMQGKQFHCLYFNAWENDFSDSPLVSLIGEIGASISALHLEKGHAKLANKLFQKAKKAGAPLVKTALPTAVKLLTSGLVDISDISNLAEDIAKKQIDKYETDKKTIVHFRRELEGLVKCISSTIKDASKKPVVFIIDELDRCRPPYAIELLEKIKHLFSVQGLVFVLAIDKRQLCESVKALYGAGMDANAYLKRFIDLEYHLPEPEIKNFISAQFDKFGLFEVLTKRVVDSSADYENILSALNDYFKLFNFAFRVQEQIFTQISIVIRTTPTNQYLLLHFVAFLICLRNVNADLYLKYVKGIVMPQEVLDYLVLHPRGGAFMLSENSCILKAYLILGINDSTARNRWIDNLRKSSEAIAGDQPAIEHAKRTFGHLQWLQRTTHGAMVNDLFKKIELSQNFIDDQT